jgi:hypothetical protein
MTEIRITDSYQTIMGPRKIYKRNGKIVYQEDCYGNVTIDEDPQSRIISFDECETPIYRILKCHR